MLGRWSLCLFAAIGLLMASAPTQAESWYQYRGPQRNGSTSEPSGWNGSRWPLTKRWQTNVGLGCTSPLLAGGKVYVMGWEYVEGNPRDRRNPIGKDTVTCLSVATGKVVWRHAYEQPRYVRCHRDDESSYGGPTSTPTLDPATGLLYVHGVDGELRCLDVRDGSQRWSFNIYDRYDVPPNPGVYPNTNKNDYGCISSPLLYKANVIIEVGSPRHGTVMAFDKRSGKPAWASQLKTWAGQTPGPQVMQVDGVPCLATLTLEHLVLIRLDAGHEGETLTKTGWKSGWDQNLALPAVAGDKVMLTGYHWINGGRNRGASAVFQASRSGLKQLWKFLPCSKSTGTTIHGNTAYVASDNLHCLDLLTGKSIWRDSDVTGDDFGCGASVILTGDDKLIYLSEKNTLYLAEPGRRGVAYKRLAKIANVLDPVKGHTWPHVALAEGHILVKDKSGHVACYATGASARRGQGADAGGIRSPRREGLVRSSTASLVASKPKARQPRQKTTRWPRFRGPDGAGHSRAVEVPTHWDEKSGKNIAWKVRAPLVGASSPVAWDGRLFLTGGDKRRRMVFSYDARTGKLLWSRTVKLTKSPTQTEDFEHLTYAGSTPVVDGRHVFAIFGNGDLVAIDFQGKVAWIRNLGNPLTGYGHCTSLVLHGELLIVQLDQGFNDRPEGRLLAVRKRDGRTVWEKKGNEHPVSDSWSSPIVAATAAGDQLITRGGGWLMARQPRTGKLLWRVESEPGDVSTSPLFVGGLVISAGYGDQTQAFRPDGKQVWAVRDGAPDVATPLAVGDSLLLFPSRDNTVTCLDLNTGARRFQHRFEGDGDGEFYASPVAVGDNVYALRSDGSAVVFRVRRQGKTWSYQPVGTGALDNQTHCWATPAVVDGALFIRSKTHLYRISRRGA